MSGAPQPRLCHLRKRPDFVEFGFNLHTEKNNNKFVHNVDSDSPASVAGLKMYDRIIEVNGINIANENHMQVVERVKSRDNEVELLVMCTEADTVFRKKKLTVTSTDDCVLHLPAPEDDKEKLDGDDKDDEDPNPPRLCELHLYDNKEYGFMLHWDQDREGQYISELDENSPATASGLRKGDKVIEVNNKSVQGKTHSDVITMMKEVPGIVKLLVVDTKSERVYRRQSIAITNSLQNIILMPPATEDKKDDEETETEPNNNAIEEIGKIADVEEKIVQEVRPQDVQIVDVQIVKAIKTPLEEPEDDESFESFSIPIIVKGVTTTVDLIDRERQKGQTDASHEGKEENGNEMVSEPIQEIPIVTIDEVDDGAKTPEIEEVAAIVAAEVTNQAIQQISSYESNDFKDQETGEPVVCCSAMPEEDTEVSNNPKTSEFTKPAEPTNPEPTIAEPTTVEPTTAEPITPEPTTAEPITPEPTTAEPITPEPTTAEPTTPEPTTAEPITPEPITPEPTTAEPITPEPITPEPTTAEPITPEPTIAEPITPEPTTAEAITPEPITPEPTTAEPITPEPIIPEPTTAEPIILEPTTQEPTTQEPTTAEPTTPESTTAEPTTPEPTTQEPTTAEPTTPESTTAEPLTSEIVVDVVENNASHKDEVSVDNVVIEDIKLVQINGLEEDKTVDESPIEPVKRTVSRYDSTPTSAGSFSMSRTTAPVPAGDAEPAIFSMSVAEARKKLVGAKQAKDVRSLQLTASAKCQIMNQL